MAEKIFKSVEEWFNQSEYDFSTADCMYRAGRYIYAVFMIHLSLEKLLKGLYVLYLNENPPRTHNLVLLQERIQNKYDMKLSGKQNELIEFLNEKSVPSRYPDVLAKVLEEYKEEETGKLLEDVRGLMQCLKNQLK